MIDRKDGIRKVEWNRRRFLELGGMLAMGCLLPGIVRAHPGMNEVQRKVLTFFITHTGERREVVYWAQGRYLPEGLATINRLLRDHRTGEVKPVDVRLLDLLHTIARRLSCCEPFHIVSGYRSPSTNALLRRQGRGVARRSLHMAGKAVDLRLPLQKLATLRDVAVNLKGGGVGYYPSSDFVHIDVGPVRHW